MPLSETTSFNIAKPSCNCNHTKYILGAEIITFGENSFYHSVTHLLWLLHVLNATF